MKSLIEAQPHKNIEAKSLTKKNERYSFSQMSRAEFYSGYAMARKRPHSFGCLNGGTKVPVLTKNAWIFPCVVIVMSTCNLSDCF